jgi:class 3 adenylate cyclase/tetratricopeptide (TPR) repeat protein
MTFDEILTQVLELLRREGRVSYRALKRRFDLDEDYLEDVKAEIIQAKKLAVDEDGAVLVWTGNTATVPAPVSDQARAPLAYTPAYLAEKIFTSRAALEGERKQVTVLFADLKGSTELIEGLDPEEARQLLDPALHVMMEAVHRYEGTVNQVLGDGVMALFGAPVAHEDHAVRACYAALAMQAAMRRYAEEVRRSHGLEMQARVGLNSGEVVVRSIGNDLHMDYSAVGQTTHLAARMEQLATPGSIRLTAATLRLAEGLVQVNALGQFPVRGLTEPVEVFELVGASAIRRRLQASAARGLTRFVGRQQELAALQQALERAGAGHGQVVAVVGEAGVGKSRLVYEFVHSHHTPGWLVLESASVSYGKATPYFPVIDLFKRYSHVEEHDDTRTIRAKVTGQVLTLDAALQDVVPALLSLLDALPEDSPFLQLDPPQRRQRTLDALKRVLLRESQVQPLILVFEDLHWIDSETQALLNNLIESLPSTRLLLLVNYRPEYQHGWGSKTYYAQLRLDPLPAVSADEFLHALLGDDASLKPLIHLLITRTEGNPFFLEESVRTLVETGVLGGERGAYRLGQALPTIQVPATVQAVLAARIDRLPPEEKHLLQTAAVIGTEVSLPLLQAIADMSEEVLHHSLTHLQAAEFLYETRLFPEREFTFKHALTHEVAYGSLLQERRRLLHARIVTTLEMLEAERLTEHVERLAHHAWRGEVWGKVVTYARQAGAKTSARSVHGESVTHFEQALAALDHLPKGREATAQAIDLRLDLYAPLFALREFHRIGDLLHQAEDLAQNLQDRQRLGRLSAYMARYLWATVNHERAVEVGQRACVIATELKDVALQAVANFTVAFAYHDLSVYGPAIELLRHNLALLEGDLRCERLGQPVLPSVQSRVALAWCLSWQGEFPEAAALIQEATRIAEGVDHPGSVAHALQGGGLLYLLKGDLDEAIPRLEGNLAMNRANQTPPSPGVLSFLAHAYALAGRVAEALPLFAQSLERAAATKFLPCNSLWIGWWGEAALVAGRLDDAMQHATRALDIAHAQKEQGYEAYARRLLGSIAVHRHPTEVEPAEAHYRQALALAEDLGMRPLQAHCHLSLGTLYAGIDQLEQARAELSTAIALYRAMEMTFWLPQAEMVLAQVSGVGETH